MTPDEWTALSHVAFGEWWDEPQDASRREAWFGLLAPFSAELVQAALMQLLRESPRFAPRLGELLVLLAPPHQPISFDEVWPALPALLSRHCTDPAAGLRAVRESCGPDFAGWVAAYGWTRLTQEPMHDPDFGGAIVHRMREHYSQLVRTDAGRRRLERALDQGLAFGELLPGSRARGPHRLSPRGALPQRAQVTR